MIVLGRFGIAYAIYSMSRFNMLPGRVIVATSCTNNFVYSIKYHPYWMEFYPNIAEKIPMFSG
jgi:hypothetical protein